MLVIHDDSVLRLCDLSVGDVFNLYEKGESHYYMVVNGEDIKICSDFACVSFEDGHIRWFSPNTVVILAKANLVVRK